MINDNNAVTLAGSVNQYKVWDANGKKYTNISIKVAVDNILIPIDVTVSEKQLTSKTFTIIQEKLARPEATIFVYGKIVEKTNKNNEVTRIIRASLSDISVQNGSRATYNNVLVSGKCENVTDSEFLIKTSYRNPLENTYKDRLIKVSHALNEKQYKSLSKAYKVVVVGSIIVDHIGSVSVLATKIYPDI